MSLRLYLVLPAVVAIVAGVYWFLSYDSVGTVMLAVFAGALAILGLSLLPTLPNVAPTAPVDDAERGGAGDEEARGH
jgi:Na+/melibiose symporter-like transporter